jgi:hypothetical protein
MKKEKKEARYTLAFLSIRKVAELKRPPSIMYISVRVGSARPYRKPLECPALAGPKVYLKADTPRGERYAGNNSESPLTFVLSPEGRGEKRRKDKHVRGVLPYPLQLSKIVDKIKIWDYNFLNGT